MDTVPSLGDEADFQRTVVPAWTDPRTLQSFVHKDLVPTKPDWSVQEYIAPTTMTEAFGDVASWVAYIQRFLPSAPGTLLTWNSSGLAAILDYPLDMNDDQRRGWRAVHPFVLSQEWNQWHAFAAEQSLSQKQAIEKLEDLAEDIIEPSPAELVNLLRNLRANVTAAAETEIRENGTLAVTFTKDQKVTSKGNVQLPGMIRIAIPVLRGDPQRYERYVRVRLSVDDNAHLLFRFSMVNPERLLESVCNERVAEAQEALGAKRPIFRANG